MVWCNHCQEDSDTDRDLDHGYVCCKSCGRVIDQEIYTNDATFVKDSSGQARLSGNIINSTEGAYSLSRERTIRKGEYEIEGIVNHLEMGGGDSTVQEARRLYEIAVDKNFTRGRRISHVAAACLYINCRVKKRPYLLIDFSDYLMISVYVLGAVFLQLCKVLRLSDHAFVQKPMDPSLFIHRFTDRLLGRRNEQVSNTARRIVASMKRDWMQTGRKPSGLCGAAIYISVLSHGLKYFKSDIVTVVHICEATLTKRLIEFENTESGGLMIEEFNARAEEMNEEPVPKQLPTPGEVVCEHKDLTHFAHGLCRSCFDDLVEVSGGLEGGTDPPAFQRAERQRRELEKAQEKIEESNDEMEADLNIGSDAIIYKSLASGEPKSDQPGETSATNEPAELENSVDNDPESLSDIDDVEVDGYLHNEEEKLLKKIIWEGMNKEYLEEQAAKEAAAAAAKEAYEASLKNLSADMISAKELVAATAEALAKSKKEKRQRRAAEKAKNSIPADSPTEATRQMLKRKTFSSRVNYQVLDTLYISDQEKAKKQRPESETGSANVRLDTIQENDDAFDAGAVDNGDEADTFEEDFAVGDYNNYGNEDETYAFGQELEFDE